jgi:hypothetical protein
MRKNARRKGVRFIESIAIGAVVVDLNKFIVGVLLLSVVDPATAGLKDGKKRREQAFFTLPRIQIRLATSSFEKISPAGQAKSAGANHRFQFQKRRQLFIRTHNETPSVAAMRVSNPDCAPFGIQS